MLDRYRHQIYDCARCGFCRMWGWRGVDNVCPIYPFTPGWETQYARGRVRMAQATLEQTIEINQAFLEHAYACTLCGSCQAHCPIGVPLGEIFHAWRVDLVAAGHILPGPQGALSMIQSFRNPYGPKPGGDGLQAVSRKDKAGILFFPGCTTTHMAEENTRAVAEILDKLGLDWTLFDEDTCCGFPLYELGQMPAFAEVAAITLGLIRQRGPCTVLTSCPACFRTLKLLYPEELGLAHGLEVRHTSKFLLPLVAARLGEVSEKVTWHDPCVLGRGLGMYEEPRELLRSVPGLELVEMASNRRDALCCGSGGGVFYSFPRVVLQAVERRLEQAQATGAQRIVTECPNCYVRFRQVARRSRMDIQVSSLSGIVNEALK